jgi:hypothetical protein
MLLPFKEDFMFIIKIRYYVCLEVYVLVRSHAPRRGGSDAISRLKRTWFDYVFFFPSLGHVQCSYVSLPLSVPPRMFADVERRENKLKSARMPLVKSSTRFSAVGCVLDGSISCRVEERRPDRKAPGPDKLPDGSSRPFSLPWKPFPISPRR